MHLIPRKYGAFALVLMAASSDDASSTADASLPNPSPAAEVGVAAAPPMVPALSAGTALEATLQDSISSTRNRAGDHVRAILSRHVLDAKGTIVIPAAT